MKLIQLTRSDGKRVGLPAQCAVMISAINEAAREHLNAPDAKTIVIADLGAQQRMQTLVRDEFTHVVNLFPVAKTGVGWTHAKDATDHPYVFPAGAICAFEEMEQEGIFALQLDLPGGPPVLAHLKASYDELKALLGEQDEGPAQ